MSAIAIWLPNGNLPVVYVRPPARQLPWAFVVDRTAGGSTQPRANPAPGLPWYVQGK